MARTRSPNYPVVDLGTAVELAGKIEKYAQRHPVPADAAVDKAWGFKASGSYGAQCIAALRQFGLLQEEDGTAKRHVRLTDEGAKIVHNHPDKVAIIKEAAVKPKVHANIWAKYGGELPPDDTIRTYLLFDHQPPFNPATVGDFLKQFRQTISFSGLDLLADESQNTAIPPGKVAKVNLTGFVPAVEIKRPPLKSGITQAVFPLDEGEALLQMPERFSKESFEDFEAWIKLVLKKAKRSIVESAQPTAEGEQQK